MDFFSCCVVLALAVSSSTAMPEPCTIPAVNHGEIGNYITRKYTRNRSRECFYQLQPGESVDNEDSVILRCEKGYSPAGSPQTSKAHRFKEDVVICEDATWSKPLRCEAEIACGQPPPIEFATVTSLFTEDYPLGAIVAYECQLGYVIKGRTTTSQCVMSDDGSQAVWTKAAMSCAVLEKRQKELECSCTYSYASGNTLAYVGDEKLLLGSKVRKGSVVRFSCQHQDMVLTLPSGLHISGSVNVTCDQCQIWQEGNVPSCVPSHQVSCDEEPPRIKNGHPLVRKRTHGHVIHYQCDEFSVKVRLGKVECIHGTWRGDPPVCVDARCYTNQLNFPGLVKPNEEFIAHLESFSILCEEDYQVTDAETEISCEMGKWEITKNPCIKVPSRQPRCPEIDGKGLFNITYSNERKINSVARYECRSMSQKIHGSNFRTCQQNGQWSGSDPVCVDITCSEFVVSGSMTVAYSKGIKVGSRAQFRCKPPAILLGSFTTRCLPNGSWSNPRPFCDESEVQCPAIDDKGIFLIRYNNERKLNSAAYYSCKERNHKLSGSNFRTCQDNREWSGTDPACSGLGCRMETLMASLPPDVVPNFEEITGDIFPSGSQLGLHCENNLALTGSKKAKCNKQGRWDFGHMQCASGCFLDYTNSPPSLIIEPVKDVYRFGELAVLSCPEGFELTADVERVMCLGRGWSDALPDCKLVINED